MSEKEIIKAEMKFLAAMKTKDIHTLDHLIHDNLLFNNPEGEIITKSIYIGSRVSGKIEGKNIITYDQEISIIDDIAIITAIIEIQEPMINKYRYLKVWKEMGNTIKLIGGSCIKIE